MIDKTLEKLGFKRFIGGEIWIKYQTINNKKSVKLIVCFTLSGKILIKDSSENIILSSIDKEEVNLFIIRECRDITINDLLSN